MTTFSVTLTPNLSLLSVEVYSLLLHAWSCSTTTLIDYNAHYLPPELTLYYSILTNFFPHFKLQPKKLHLSIELCGLSVTDMSL